MCHWYVATVPTLSGEAINVAVMSPRYNVLDLKQEVFKKVKPPSYSTVGVFGAEHPPEQ